MAGLVQVGVEHWAAVVFCMVLVLSGSVGGIWACPDQAVPALAMARRSRDRAALPVLEIPQGGWRCRRVIPRASTPLGRCEGGHGLVRPCGRFRRHSRRGLVQGTTAAQCSTVRAAPTPPSVPGVTGRGDENSCAAGCSWPPTGRASTPPMPTTTADSPGVTTAVDRAAAGGFGIGCGRSVGDGWRRAQHCLVVERSGQTGMVGVLPRRQSGADAPDAPANARDEQPRLARRRVAAPLGGAPAPPLILYSSIRQRVCT